MGLFSRRNNQSAAQRSQQLVERYLNEAFIGGSAEALEATVNEKCRLWQILPIFWNAFADRHATIQVIFSSADGQLVADHITFEGRHVGPWLNIQPTGKALTLDATAIFHVADGKIDDFWLTWNWLPLVQ